MTTLKAGDAQCLQCGRIERAYRMTRRGVAFYCDDCVDKRTQPKDMNPPTDEPSRPADIYCSICGTSHSPTGWWGSAPHFYCDVCSGPQPKPPMRINCSQCRLHLESSTMTADKDGKPWCGACIIDWDMNNPGLWHVIGPGAKDQNPPKPQQIPESVSGGGDTSDIPSPTPDNAKPPMVHLSRNIAESVFQVLLNQRIKELDEEHAALEDALNINSKERDLLRYAQNELDYQLEKTQKPQ